MTKQHTHHPPPPPHTPISHPHHTPITHPPPPPHTHHPPPPPSNVPPMMTRTNPTQCRIDLRLFKIKRRLLLQRNNGQKRRFICERCLCRISNTVFGYTGYGYPAEFLVSGVKISRQNFRIIFVKISIFWIVSKTDTNEIT